MIAKSRVEEEIRSLKEDLVKLWSDIIHEFPFEEYSAYLIDRLTYLGYGRHPYIGRRRRNWFRSILSLYDPAILCLFNKLLMACLIQDSLDKLPHKSLCADIVEMYHRWFERVLNDFEKQPDDYYRSESEAFGIDLSICCLRSIPVGGAWVVQKSRIGWGPFIGGGLRQFFVYLAFTIRKAGGFSPFCVIHTAGRYIPVFKPEEMDLAYMRIAELMKSDPALKGIYRASWFLDPSLEEVSPNLAFLRTVPEQNGARLFRSVTVRADINWALSLSSERRKLYKEGKYRPTSYAYIWPRMTLLEWAERQNEK